MPVQNPAAVRTSDARSDDRTREIAFSSRSVLIARRVAGIAMRVEVPLSSYRGVALSLGAEPEAGAVHRIELLHRDPDLSILLKRDHQLGRDRHRMVRVGRDAVAAPALRTRADGRRSVGRRCRELAHAATPRIGGGAPPPSLLAPPQDGFAAAARDCLSR